MYLANSLVNINLHNKDKLSGVNFFKIYLFKLIEWINEHNVKWKLVVVTNDFWRTNEWHYI